MKRINKDITSPLTDYEIDKAQWYWRRGYSTYQIAHFLRVSEPTIANQIELIRSFQKGMIIKAGVTSGFTGDKVAQAHWLLKQGYSLKQTAKCISVSEDTLSAYKHSILMYQPEDNAA